MSLKEYREKRDFRKTEEPKGKKKKSTGRMFCVQKHDASSLHYDFRLELDGVLKSWAVPKGPCLDPAEKRLAVHVEDHPVDYGSFEGVIPEDEYGAGTVMLWDKGTWEPQNGGDGGYSDGSMKMTLKGEKLKGGWALVHMKGRGEKNWLLIKEKDDEAKRLKDGDILEQEATSVKTGRDMEEIADEEGEESGKDSKRKKKKKDNPGVSEDLSKIKGSRKKGFPKNPTPELATLVKEAPEGENWVHEIKFDGYRILAQTKDGQAKLTTRNGKDWTSKFPPVKEALDQAELPDCIIDGEVVAMTKSGRTDFQTLQNAMKDGKKKNDIRYYTFDLLYLDGYDLTGSELTKRKKLLKEIINKHVTKKSVLQYSDHTSQNGKDFHEEACKQKLEGIISKRADSGYTQKRTRDWLKVKCANRQEVVIVGYTPPGGSRKHFGALVTALYQDGEFVFSGKIGTGYDEQTLKDVHEKLSSITRKTSPLGETPKELEREDVTWVTPKYLAEVEFTEMTSDGLLRHPAFKGLRTDKSPKEGKPEKPVDNPGNSSDNKDPRVGGVRISNPDKVLYPDMGLTKRGLAEYFDEFGEYILEDVRERPLSIVRCPQGREKKCFYQKHMSDSLPDDFHEVRLKEESGTGSYFYITEKKHLIQLAQLGALELHPWGSRIDKVEKPDRMVFDLDPDEGVSSRQLVEATRRVHDFLKDELGWDSFLKTSGGKGFHIIVPLVRRSGWEEVKDTAGAIAKAIAKDEPKKYVATMSKEKRKGKVFIDYLRNGRGATCVAAYCTRARKNAPLSAPVRWDELSTSLPPDHYNVKNIAGRLSSLKGDPWDGYGDAAQQITKAVKKRLGI